MKATFKFKKNVSIKNIFLSLIIGLALATGTTFAWDAIWQGTNWIKTGAVISAQKIAENFEYLYSRVGPEGDLVPPECWGKGKKLGWKDNKWICEEFKLKGCKLRYKIIDSNGKESAWKETPFGGDGNGEFVWGQSLTTNYLGYTKLKVGIFCEDVNHKMGYKVRGNHGPYWDNGMTVIDSKKGQWVDGNWSGTGYYSCAIKGGDAACGAAVKDYVSNGCVTAIDVNGDIDTGDESSYQGAVSRGYAELRMGIKCSE